MLSYFLIFFFGASIGSFVNVMIDRTIQGKNWIWGSSKCDHCQKKLSWYDMIPILSFLVYRARSRCCRKHLSYRYPLVEAMVGMLFVWWYLVGYLFFRLVSAPLDMIQPGFWLLTGILLLVMAFADLFYNAVLLPVIWTGIAMTGLYRLVLWRYDAYQIQDLWQAGLVAILSYGLFWFLYKITKGKGMADGDMYVALYMSFLVGYPKAILMLGLSFVYGAVVGVLLIMSKIRKRRDTLPFVPFMVLASITVLVWGEKLLSYF